MADQVTAREILARFDGLAERVEVVAKDAREGRDATIALNSRLSAENTQEQITAIWARMEKSDAAHRADLQNSYARINEASVGRFAELEIDRKAWKARVEALEAWRERLEGASGLVGWLAKHAPWLVTVAVAIVALVGVKHD